MLFMFSGLVLKQVFTFFFQCENFFIFKVTFKGQSYVNDFFFLFKVYGNFPPYS